MPGEYQNPGPSRGEIDASKCSILLEFGAGWCDYCQAAAPAIAQSLDEFPNVQHIKIEDGSGRRLGRSFRVKLWPTVILLKDGQELARVIRPESDDDLRPALQKIS